MLCSIRFAHPSSERFWVLAHSDSVMVFQVDFHCKNVKLRRQIRGWMSNHMVPIYIFGDYNHHGVMLCSLFPSVRTLPTYRWFTRPVLPNDRAIGSTTYFLPSFLPSRLTGTFHRVTNQAEVICVVSDTPVWVKWKWAVSQSHVLSFFILPPC